MRSCVPTLRGSTTPRIFTAPLVTGGPGPCGCGCALSPATSLGFSAVDFGRDVLGIEPLPWQRWLLIHALELREDSRFRYRTVLILVARQNGKTTIVEIKNLWKMFVLRVPLVIGTAQNLDISEESWDKAVEIAESVPELRREVAHVDRTNGKKALRLVHGSRWKIAAASRRGGRGLSGDDVNLDELREHTSWEAWAAVTKTTMARRNPQVWAFSNAGDDHSVVLNDLQEKGRAAAEDPPTDSSLGHFEWSAPDDVRCTCGRGEGESHRAGCGLRDRQVWAWANPSLGYTVSEEALESALATDPEAIFRTECLCQRVPSLAPDWQVISEAAWRGLVAEPQRPADVALAVQVDHRRTHTAIVAVGPRGDGSLLVSVVDYRPGTQWVVGRLAQLAKRWNPVAIAVQDKGPTGSLLDDMARAGLEPSAVRDAPARGELAVPWADDVADAWGMFVDAVHQRRLWHLDEVPLNLAVAATRTRRLAGGTAWDYRVDGAAPLMAATLAHWAYLTRVDQVAEANYDILASVH